MGIEVQIELIMERLERNTSISTSSRKRAAMVKGPCRQNSSYLAISLMLWFMVPVDSLMAQSPRQTLRQRTGEILRFDRYLRKQDEADNVRQFRSNWPIVWRLSQEVSSELKRIGLRNIPKGSVDFRAQIIDDQFLPHLRGDDSTWARHFERAGEKYAIRITRLPLGALMTREEAIDKFIDVYHDANSFYDKPRFDANSMKVSFSENTLYYEQEVAVYRFSTQERFNIEYADFESIFWNSPALDRRAAGVDVVLLVPSPGKNGFSSVLLITVYDDSSRPNSELNDTRDQHRAILKSIKIRE